jgi:TRAP-type C4-dicarboxylate transport system permease small subunit
MNDKDRDLIEQILHAAGTAGEKGFGYLVKWMVYDGILSAITCSVFVAVAIFLGWKVFKWEPKTDWDDHPARFIRAALLVVFGIVIVISVNGICDNIVQALIPEGAAIRSAIHHS